MNTFKYKAFYLMMGVVLLSIGACVKDNTTGFSIPIPQLSIDTAGAQKDFQVYQSSGKVEINPKVVFDGAPEELSYQYRLYAPNNSFDTLSRSKTLSSIISSPPGTYTIEYEVMHTKTGLKALTRYTVTVLSPVPGGWMVMYEPDGNSGSTELDIIRSPIFSSAASDSVYRGLYGFWNGGAILPGTPRSLLYTSTELFAFTSSTGLTLQLTDIKKLRTLNQLFPLAPPSPLNVDVVFGGFNGNLLINDEGIYWVNGSLFIGKATIDGGYKAGPYYYAQAAQNAGFYDKQARRFLYLRQQSSVVLAYPNANATARFNLNNLGKDVLFVERSAGGAGGDPFKLAFLKDISGNGRYVYVFSTFTPATPDVAVFDLTSAPEIQNALFYGAGNIGNTAFYATSSQVYWFNYTNTPSVYSTPQIGFTAPAGEVITAMRLHKSYGVFGVANDSKWMFVATWNSSIQKGKVYLMDVSTTSGAISAPIGSWVINGKVKDMTLKIN